MGNAEKQRSMVELYSLPNLSTEGEVYVNLTMCLLFQSGKFTISFYLFSLTFAAALRYKFI